jgi:RNA polymerase sigma factor (TIGR02999 family)
VSEGGKARPRLRFGLLDWNRKHLNSSRVEYILFEMSHITEILNAAAEGRQEAAEALLPLLYDELRQLAARQLAHEKPGQTLDATGLVHEAYLRLVGAQPPHDWNGRGHFFGAAAEAMRRILVERARRNQTFKHGGGRVRVEFHDELPVTHANEEHVLAVNDALDALIAHDPQAAELVKLHFFAGLSIEEVAAVQGISARTAFRNWSFAKAWLFRHLEAGQTLSDG